ncbi:MAG TPA: hypothetical protein VIG88_12950 [Lysobacter sp.]
MNRLNAQSLAFRARATVTNIASKVAAGTGLVVAGITAAHAQAADPGAAILSEITGAKATVGGILVALAAVLGLFLLWSMIKRAK